jgi:DNA-binding NtrC family response regulator
VLVVDDDPIARRVLAAVVRAAGEFRVQTAATEEEARAATEAEAPRFAVVDVWLRGGDASGLVRCCATPPSLPTGWWW